MATTNETRGLERKANELMALARAAGPEGRGPGGAPLADSDRSAIDRLRGFVDHLGALRRDLTLAPDAAAGRGATALLARLENRYLTDDIGAGGGLYAGFEGALGHEWSSSIGYWGLDEAERIIIELEEDEDAPHALAESTEVRRAVRRSLFERREAARRAASPKGARPGSQPVRAGAPRRPAIWDAPQPTLLEMLTDAPLDPETARTEQTQAPDAAPGATPTARQGLEWRQPYPRGLGKAGARYVTPVARSLARLASSSPQGAVAGRDLRAVSRSIAARASNGGPLATTAAPRGDWARALVGADAERPGLVAAGRARPEDAVDGRAAAARDRLGARGLLGATRRAAAAPGAPWVGRLDDLAIGRRLPALSTALRVAGSAFVPGLAGTDGTTEPGVFGPAILDRMLTTVRVAAAPSSDIYREPLEVAWVAPDAIEPPASGASEPRADSLSAPAAGGRRTSVSLFDVVPSARAARGRLPAAPPATTWGPGTVQGLPAAERFAHSTAGRRASSGRAADPGAMLGSGWTLNDPAGTVASSTHTRRLAGGGADAGTVGAFDSILLSPAALGLPTRGPVSTWEASRPSAGSRMGRLVQDRVASLSLGADEATLVLRALRAAGSDTTPEGIRRALTRVAGAAPLALRSVAETVLLDLPTPLGGGTVGDPELAVSEAARHGRSGAAAAARRLGGTRQAADPSQPSRGQARPSVHPSSADSPALRVAVRTASGALVALPGFAASTEADGATGVARGAVDVVIPAPATGSGATLAAAPTLLRSLDARQLGALASAAQTDTARAFALGLPESVIASVRGLSEGLSGGAPATYQALLRHAAELDLLTPPAEWSSGDATAGGALGQAHLSLDDVRTIGRRASAGTAGALATRTTGPLSGAPARGAVLTGAGEPLVGTGRGRQGAVPTAGMAAALTAARASSAAGAASAASGRAAGMERLLWSASSMGGGLTLELVDAGSAQTAVLAQAGVTAVRMPDGTLVPLGQTASRAHRDVRHAAARAAVAAGVTPTAGVARSTLGFASRHLGALGMAASGRTQAPSTAATREYGLGVDLDLLAPEAAAVLAGDALDAPGGLTILERHLARRGATPTLASTDELVTAAAAPQAGVAPVRSRALLRGAAAELGFVVPESADGVTSVAGVAPSGRARAIGHAGRRASHFRPVAALTPGTTATAGEPRAGAAPVTAPDASTSGAQAIGAPSVTRGRRPGTASAFGLDISLDAALVSSPLTEGGATPGRGEGPTGDAAGQRRGADGRRTGRGGASPAASRSTAHAAAPETATWTQLSSLLRRLSNGGSATPLQRELSVMLQGLPASVAAQVAMQGGSVGFSRDLLVRLESAIDTLAGASAVEQVAAGLRGSAVAPVSRLSDLGAADLISLQSPVLGADPFEATGRPSGLTAGSRRSPGSAASDRAPSVTPPAQAPVAPAALDGLDWSLVSPHAPAREGNRSTPDMGGLARAALSGGSVARADLPLIAPATVAVAAQAQLSAREDRVPEASAPANVGRTDAKKPAEAKVDLDKLAVEIANKLSIKNRVDLERRGIWHSHKT